MNRLHESFTVIINSCESIKIINDKILHPSPILIQEIGGFKEVLDGFAEEVSIVGNDFVGKTVLCFDPFWMLTPFLDADS